MDFRKGKKFDILEFPIAPSQVLAGVRRNTEFAIAVLQWRMWHSHWPLKVSRISRNIHGKISRNQEASVKYAYESSPKVKRIQKVETSMARTWAYSRTQSSHKYLTKQGDTIRKNKIYVVYLKLTNRRRKEVLGNGEALGCRLGGRWRSPYPDLNQIRLSYK